MIALSKRKRIIKEKVYLRIDVKGHVFYTNNMLGYFLFLIIYESHILTRKVNHFTSFMQKILYNCNFKQKQNILRYVFHAKHNNVTPTPLNLNSFKYKNKALFPFLHQLQFTIDL